MIAPLQPWAPPTPGLPLALGVSWRMTTVLTTQPFAGSMLQSSPTVMVTLSWVTALTLADAPVNLEPSPVPMLLIGAPPPPAATHPSPASTDAVLCGTADTAQLHGLTPVHISAPLPQHPFPQGQGGSEGESGGAPAYPHPHPFPHTTTICDWVGSHF